jgi:hypothetical protein
MENLSRNYLLTDADLCMFVSNLIQTMTRDLTQFANFSFLKALSFGSWMDCYRKKRGQNNTFSFFHQKTFRTLSDSGNVVGVVKSP